VFNVPCVGHKDDKWQSVTLNTKKLNKKAAAYFEVYIVILHQATSDISDWNVLFFIGTSKCI